MDTCKECGHNHPEGNHLPMNIEAFKAKYGTRTLGLLIGSFIAQAPKFPGDNHLAQEIGKIMGDLEFALEHK